MKVCYAHHGHHIYDQRFLESLCEARHDVHLITFYGGKLLIPNKVKVYRPFCRIDRLFPLYPIPLIGSLLFLIKTLMRCILLFIMVKAIMPDLINGHYLTQYAFYAAVSHARPMIATVWGSDVLIEPKKSFLCRFIAKYALARSDVIIVDSHVQKHEVMNLVGNVESKIETFPWGVDLEKFHASKRGLLIRKRFGWDNNPIVIITRQHREIYKVETLIKAIPYIIKYVPQARFLILGYGPLTNKLRKMVKELMLENYIIFTGNVDYENIPDYLNSATIYASTSSSNGSSCSLLEAMACGLAVVVTDIPGNQEWVKDGVNGLLVGVGDHIALANKIKLLLTNEGLRERFSFRNLKIAKIKANWKIHAKKYNEIIRNAIK